MGALSASFGWRRTRLGGAGTPPARTRQWRWTVAAITAILIFTAQVVVLGADCLWLVALGRWIVHSGHIPDVVPFAAAPTSGWPNVPALGEVLLAGAAQGGVTGLAVLQVVLDAVVLMALAVAARRNGAGDRGTALALALVALGGVSALVVVRAQVFSLPLFVVLIILLRAEEAMPTRRIWLVVPLLTVWANLHGAVLVGLGVTGVYLVLSRLRLRTRETAAVGIASLLAITFTPALWHTPGYYLGVLTNAAAERGVGLWSPIDLFSPLDVLLILCAVALGLAAARSGRPRWEVVVVIALAIGTALTARNGIWLLLFLAVPAAVGLTGVGARWIRSRATRVAEPGSGVAPPRSVLGAVLAVMVLAGALVVVRGDAVNSVDPRLVTTVRSLATGRVVLAPPLLSESLVDAGGATVWVANPLDAFRRADQRAYLDFLDGGPTAPRAVAASDLVVLEPGAPSTGLVTSDPTLTRADVVDGWTIYVRTAPRGP